MKMRKMERKKFGDDDEQLFIYREMCGGEKRGAQDYYIWAHMNTLQRFGSFMQA